MSDFGTDDIYNLAAAYNSLSEIDAGLLNPIEQESLSLMKAKIMASLEYFISVLPEFEEEND